MIENSTFVLALVLAVGATIGVVLAVIIGWAGDLSETDISDVGEL